MLVVYIVLGVIVLIALAVWATYNSLVRLNIKTDEALSDITVQMKRRFDLIPNLVKTVKGYAKHEQQTLEKVIQARNQAISAGSIVTEARKPISTVTASAPTARTRRSFMPLVY